MASDPEWAKLAAVPGMTEPWADVRDKWKLATDEFKARGWPGGWMDGPCLLGVFVKLSPLILQPTNSQPRNPQLVILETHGRKKAETAEFRAALQVRWV